MNKYTIKPLHQLLMTEPPREITARDITDLLAKIKKNQKLPGQKRPEEIYENYIKILTQLQKHLQATGEISREKMITWVDYELRKNDFMYHLQTHRCACNNVFSGAQEGRKTYDVGLYSHYSSHQDGGHHRTNKVFTVEHLKEQLTQRFHQELSKSSTDLKTVATHALNELDDWLARLGKYYYCVCYARFEEFADRIIIGNMQIDSKKRNWEKSDMGKILSQTCNIYHILVQEAIKQALTAGKKKIIFQAGYAAEISQWGDGGSMQDREMVTSDNIDEYQKRYQTLREKYENLAAGDLAYTNNGKPARIIKNEQGSLQAIPEHSMDLLPLVFNLPFYEDFRPGLTFEAVEKDLIMQVPTAASVRAEALSPHMSRLGRRGMSYSPSEINYTKIQKTLLAANAWKEKSESARLLHNAHLEHYRYITLAAFRRDPETLLCSLNKIFDYIGCPAEEDREAKLCYLGKLLEGLNIQELSEASYKNSDKAPLFTHLQPFMLKFNYHQKILSRIPRVRELSSPTGFFHTQTDFGIKLRPLVPPEINSLVAPELLNYIETRYPVFENTALYQWYERVLPGVLKKFKINYKKVTIVTSKRAEHQTAYGWEITTPREELLARPLVIF